MKRYADAGISKYRFFELKNIALQYDEMIKAEKKLRRGEVDRVESGNQTWKRPDPTGNAAINIAIKSNAPKIRAIEESVQAAGPEIYTWLLRHVTRGETYEQLNPPCGRAQFYRAHQRFFMELDRRVS